VIHVHERFVVAADPRTVWEVISDPRAVVGCVPGASLGEQHEDGSLDASVTVTFGPVRVAFQARVTLELDDAAMIGHVTGRGKDNQGGTRVTSTMTFKVTEESQPGSMVVIDGEADISGKLASMIESGASIVVNRMSGEFAANLAQRCVRMSSPAPGKKLPETEGDGQ
jgi:carbon monoxide dehydrogenase subunit G